MSEKMDRKNFMLAIPAALAALVLHKSEEEPTVILEQMTINTGSHSTIQGFNVYGLRDQPGVTVQSSEKGPLKDHPRAAEIEEKIRRQRLERRRKKHEQLMGNVSDDVGDDGIDFWSPDPPPPRLPDGAFDDSS
jgi:hypothetical protein